MPRSLPLGCLALLVAVPAWAAQQAPAASLYHQQDSRSIAIHNLAHQSVTAARVQTTDGRTWNLAKGSIPQNQAKEIIVPARDCITAIRVTLQNGRTLGQTGLNACRNTEIVVQDNRVMIPQQAVPGAQQHGTPG
jgi:hypothetical protein